MLVISRDLVLSAAEASYAANPSIGWHNLVTAANIAATSASALYPVSNLANPSTSTFMSWHSASTSNQYHTVTLDGFTEVDYLAVARHNFGSAQIVVSVEANSGAGFVEVVQEQLLADDAPVMFAFTALTPTAVRLRMQPSGTAPRAAVLYVGKLLRLPRSIRVDARHTPFEMGRVTRIVNGRSENGNFLGRIVLSEMSQSIADFEWFEPIWYRTHFHPFLQASKDTPFFFAWNPTEYVDEVGYAWMMEEPHPEIDPVTRWVAVSLKMQGIAA